MTLQATTLRIAAQEAIKAELGTRLRNEHRRGYYTLHIRRDGTATWYHDHNSNSDLIDPRSDEFGFAPIPSVCQVGTGSVDCDCDWCGAVYSATSEAYAVEMGREYNKEEKFATQEEAIEEAALEADGSDLLEEMIEKLNLIEVGYFDDERQ